jgi:hypothetical protein
LSTSLMAAPMTASLLGASVCSASHLAPSSAFCIENKKKKIKKRVSVFSFSEPAQGKSAASANRIIGKKDTIAMFNAPIDGKCRREKARPAAKIKNVAKRHRPRDEKTYD